MPGLDSDVAICNRALSAIGARAGVTSLVPGADQSNAAIQCSLLYDETRQEVLREARWNFARKEALLTLLKTAPIVTPGYTPTSSVVFWPFMPWWHEFAYPSDCLQFQMIIAGALPGQPVTQLTTAPASPSSSVGYPGGVIPWQELQDTDANGNAITVIGCNLNPAQGEYTTDVRDATRFDNGFREALVGRMAQKLVMPLSGNLQLAQVVIARGEAAITRARAQDANEGVKSMDHTPDWIRARGRNGPRWGGSDYWRP